jgi:hypothetical protein
MAFERRFTEIKKLKAKPLFQQCLLPDIINRFEKRPDRYRDVFPAVRKDRIDFYHKGGKLFSYDGKMGFITHHKYASVIKYDTKKPYVSDANLQAIDNFIEGYERIKENCSLYSGIEANGVARVYGDYSCAKQKKLHRVVVLDIEVSLRRENEADELEPGKKSRAKSDRIDLLLFDTESCLLRFFEAKDFSNSEIRAEGDHEPKIVKQMQRYKDQLNASNVRQEMLAGYSAHVDIINQLFSPKVPLPTPQDIDPVPRLLIFGFDKPQLKEKLENEINCLENDYKLAVYAIGNISLVEPNALFSGGKKRWPTISTKDLP